jgi:hypothetical protein
MRGSDRSGSEFAIFPGPSNTRKPRACGDVLGRRSVPFRRLFSVFRRNGAGKSALIDLVVTDDVD